MLSEAEALLGGDAEIASRLASQLLKPLKNNFVERPWGGTRIRELKGMCPLPDQPAIGGAGLGESFEIAADDGDEEARRYPSRLRMADGSELSLPALLRVHGERLLGAAFSRRHGGTFPLLPKFLDIRELLSVQGHPEGNTEAYIIVHADPGATIRLGFKADIDAASFQRELEAGRRLQETLLEDLGADVDPAALQASVAAWFAGRELGAGPLRSALPPPLAGGARLTRLVAQLAELKTLYWRVLDAMNAIPVRAGLVIHNATPTRILAASGRAPSAEVHALGNPEGREIVALEIRRPGPTFRAWDNVRFPIRAVDVGRAIDALNLRQTAPAEFLAEPQSVAPGVMRSIDSPYFRIEHLCPVAGQPVRVAAAAVHCLHAVRGTVTVFGAAGGAAGSLERGESAIMPAGVGAYRVESDSDAAELVKVSLPEDG